MGKYILLSTQQQNDWVATISSVCEKESSRILGIGMPMDFSYTQTVLTREDLRSPETAFEKLCGFDVICFGKDAISMMPLFKKYGWGSIFEKLSQNTCLCGVGEGATVLCSFGQVCRDAIHSRRVSGLGFLKFVFCPFIVEAPQRTGWLKSIMKRTYRMTAIALDDAALVIEDDQYYVRSFSVYARARKCYWMKKQYFVDNIRSGDRHPLLKILQKG